MALYNRELSWIAFNERVLEEALDPARPLLERVKFLAIYSSNLDEFTMVRLAAVLRQRSAGYAKPDASGETPVRLLTRCAERIAELEVRLRKAWDGEIAPSLRKEGFSFLRASDLVGSVLDQTRLSFHRDLHPILTPMAVDPGRPFPFLAGKHLHLLVELAKEGEGRSRWAIVPIPASRRFWSVGGQERSFLPSEELVRANLGELFSGYRILGHSVFRILRDAELELLEEEATDLIEELEDELRRRERGEPVRLELEASAPPSHLNFLAEHLGFDSPFLGRIEGMIDLGALFAVATQKGADDLRDAPWPAVEDKGFARAGDSVFTIIRERDRLISLPYERFDPVVRFLEEAAEDPDVLALKMTLYRTSGDSPVVKALMRASRGGKNVTVLVEVKARFDEARNIGWARELENAGCHVIYGLVGMKIHAKLALVVRRETEGLRRYVHLSTGNYNDRTARLYTDIGLFTASSEFGRDASEVFNVLTGYSDPPRWRKLAVAPVGLRKFFLEKIEREKRIAAGGGRGRVWAKMNSLEDPGAARAVIEAARAGVEFDLVIRGICILPVDEPGTEGRIRVRSIVDRYLEHSRIWIFGADGENEVWLGSADWMRRNLDRRVEIVFPVEDPTHRKEIVEMMGILLDDNVQARILGPGGVYRRLRPAEGEPRRHAQRELYEHNLRRNEAEASVKPLRFVPVHRTEN